MHPTRTPPAVPAPRGRRPAPLPRGQLLAIWLTVLTCVGYGLMNTSYPWTLLTGQVSWSTRALMALVSPDFMSGSAHVPEWLANYTRATGSIGLHAALGGLALSLCAAQFIPGMRQRWPRVHRAIGWSAVGTCLLSMVGSVAFLLSTPLQQVFGGPIFGIGLWLLAFSTAMSLTQGVLMARQRRWPEHMGWMTLTTTLLMAAPLLRVGDVVLGRSLPIRVDDAGNLLVAGLTTVSAWMGLWWATRAGQRELPLPPGRLVLPPAAWAGLAALGVMLVAHEWLLVPWGLDALAWLGHPRTAADLMPRAATPWALLTLLVLPETARVLRDEAWHQGDMRLPRSQAWLALTQGLAALWTASTWGAGGWAHYNQAALTGYWAFSGGVSVCWGLAGSRPPSRGRTWCSPTPRSPSPAGPQAGRPPVPRTT